MRSWPALLMFLALVAAAGAIGALAAPDVWYASLVKPTFNPPNAIFAPVWSLLYALIAIAAWRVYRVAGWCKALAVWLVQLACNAAWSPLFFALHRIGLRCWISLCCWL